MQTTFGVIIASDPDYGDSSGPSIGMNVNYSVHSIGQQLLVGQCS